VLTGWAPSRVFLARESVDGRKGIDGLCQVVRDVFGDDPFAGAAFLFFNRRRNRIKALVWDANGFWLLVKRLERGTFGVLEAVEGATGARVALDRAELSMLLEGIDRKSARFRRRFARRVRIEGRSRDGRADRPFD
jgi:transposase